MNFKSKGLATYMQLKNCESCGAVFADAVRTICRDCYYAEEEAFQKVYRFLVKKENREATITEISKATEVEEDLIIKFMRQNRLRASEFPKLSYPCERCGIEIVEGKLCEACKAEMLENLTMQEKNEGIQKKSNTDEQPVYYTFNKDRRKDRNK